jgi:hypothetical protein
MAINFLSSTAMNLTGRDIGDPQLHGFCSFNGFMTQVFVIQTDYWVLLIAVCTYFILADHKRAASWVQDHLLILASLPWIFSILWASIGLGVTGYGSIGACRSNSHVILPRHPLSCGNDATAEVSADTGRVPGCWFTSDEVRLLVNFIPRWIIIIAVLAMYARLYLVLFKAHKFMSSNEESSGHPTSGSRSRTLDGAANISGSRPMNSTSQQAYAHGRPLKTSKRLKKVCLTDAARMTRNLLTSADRSACSSNAHVSHCVHVGLDATHGDSHLPSLDGQGGPVCPTNL